MLCFIEHIVELHVPFGLLPAGVASSSAATLRTILLEFAITLASGLVILLPALAGGSAKLLVTVFVRVLVKASPAFLLLFLYLLQSFQSLFILVFVLFLHCKVVLRLQKLIVV